MANQQTLTPNASNLLMILLMPQQVSPSINDDIYPGNKTILQVSLGGPYALSCESGSHLGVEMVIRESLPSPPPPTKKTQKFCLLWVLGWLSEKAYPTPSPSPPPPTSQIQELCLIQELCITRCWVGYLREPDPPTPQPPTPLLFFFLRTLGTVGFISSDEKTC